MGANGTRMIRSDRPEPISPLQPPWVTVGLAGTWVVVYGLSLAVGEGPDGFWTQWGLVPRDFRLLTDLTHAFVQGGWLPLLGNLAVLLVLGPPLESRWGRALFGGFYVAAGVTAGAFYAAMTPYSARPLVGASGANAALVAACLMRFAGTGVALSAIERLRSGSGSFCAPFWAIASAWLVWELALAFLTRSSAFSTGVGYWAQVGGVAFGLSFAVAVRRARLEQRLLGASDDDGAIRASHPRIQEALSARERGDDAGALEQLREALQAEPDVAELIVAYWELACACGRAEEAAPSLLRLVKQDLVDGGDRERAAHHWRELVRQVPDARAEPHGLLQLAPVFIQAGRPADAALALRHAVDGGQARVAPGVALRVAELARHVDAGVALQAARRALDAEGMDASKRERIAALVAELEAARNREAEPVRPGAEPVARRETRDPDAAEAAATPKPAPVADPEPDPPAQETRAAIPELGEADLGPRFASVKTLEAVPVSLLDARIEFERPGGHSGHLDYASIEAVAAAAVRGLAAKPVLLIDLVLNWTSLGEEILRVVRIRSDRFDPLPLTPGESAPLAAFRAILATLLERSGATALPDPASAAGRPFRSFDALTRYEREVLQVDA